MSVDPKLLEILVCPVTKQSLKKLSADKLTSLNQAISNGDITTLDGELVSSPLQQALITRNGTHIYRVESDIPIMLEDQSIYWHDWDAT